MNAISMLDGNVARHLNETNQKIENLERKVTNAVKSSPLPTPIPAPSSPAPAPVENKVTPKSTLSTGEMTRLRTLSDLLDELQSLHGDLPELIPGKRDPGKYYPNFLAIIRSKWMNRNEVKAMLNDLGWILDAPPENIAELEQETGIFNLARKINNLNWLKWRMGFLL